MANKRQRLDHIEMASNGGNTACLFKIPDTDSGFASAADQQISLRLSRQRKNPI